MPSVAAWIDRRAELFPLTPDDYGWLMSVESDPAIAAQWRFGRRTPDPSSYAADLWSGVVVQFVVVAPATGRRVGLVTAYDADPRAGVTKLAVVGRGTSSGLTTTLLCGVAKFLCFCFDEFPIRTVRAATSATTFRTIRSGLGVHFRCEARRREHLRVGLELEDQIVLAIDRDDWFASMRRPARSRPVRTLAPVADRPDLNDRRVPVPR